MTVPPPIEAASAELVSTCGEITRISDFGCKDGVSDEHQGQVELGNKKAMIARNEPNDMPPSSPVLPAAACLKRKRGRPTKEESALRAQTMALRERSTRAKTGKRKRGRPRKEEDVQAQSKLSFPSRVRKPTCDCSGSRREEACNTVSTATTTIERPADDSDFRAEVKQLRLAQERQLEIITEQTLTIYKLNAEQSRQASEIRQLKQELQASRQPPCGDKEKEGEENDVDQPLVRTSAKLLYCMDKLFEHIFTRRMRTSDRFLSDIRVELGDERVRETPWDGPESFPMGIRRKRCYFGKGSARIGSTVLVGERGKMEQTAHNLFRALLGVGSVATQIARRILRLPVVVTTASRPETTEFSRSMGATHVVNHREPLPPQVEALALPIPIKYVFITYRTEQYMDATAAICAPFGKLLGPKPWYGVDVESHGEILRRLASWVDEGKIESHLRETMPLTVEGVVRARQAVEASRVIGKVGLEIWQDGRAFM
ncbi:hypothetical protein IWZ03DRAFT_405185 [Phyllosticta citriasiana]|uniref:Alcohol dehydrogenase-like C-terminal domain-containing protein n=1 Tax=Phyllosticta citriasiana TaxID=595635 RepID=A0ABR1KU90_9PEZI